MQHEACVCVCVCVCVCELFLESSSFLEGILASISAEGPDGLHHLTSRGGEQRCLNEEMQQLTRQCVTAYCN